MPSQPAVALTKPGLHVLFAPLQRFGRHLKLPGIKHAPLPHPHLRRAPRSRHRPGGAAFRLVPSHPRPWRRAVHRPARPLRLDPGGGGPGFARPSRWPRRCARNGWCGSTARCASARRAPSIRTCRPARSRSISARSRCSGRPANCRCRCSASRTIRRRSGSNTASSICAASKLHQNIMMRGQVINSIRRRMKESGFFEFQTPILTASSPEGARDYPGAVAAASRKVLRAAAGAAAVQAARSWCRASTAISRSRRASATRMRAPTVRPASSTSSTSR